MRRQERPITTFRRRLLRLIDEQCEGKYTRLAHRAGIPVSTMQHYLHAAKHQPGGEHLLKMAHALGVTVHYLVTGDERVRPAAPLAPPTPVVPREIPAVRGFAPYIALPMFTCECPGPCPLTGEVPPVGQTHAKILLEATLLPMHEDHRLIAVQVDPRLPCTAWPMGARLVVDLDARTPEWANLTLLHAENRCRLGHVMPAGDRLLFAARVDGAPEVVSRESQVLGTIVAGVTSL